MMFLVGMHVLSFLQCFDTIGWVTGRASGLQKSCATCMYPSGKGPAYCGSIR